MAVNLANNIKLIGNKFHWGGSPSHLKKFVSKTLGLVGKWTSSGGDAKLCDGLNIKWRGKKSKRISLTGDPIKINDLSEVLKSLIKLSAERLSSEREVCNGSPTTSELEISTSIIEDSVYVVNDSTLVNDNTKVLDNNNLLSFSCIKPMDSSASELSHSKFGLSI